MHGADKAVAGLEMALQKLRLGYLDLFLVHTPMGGQVGIGRIVALHHRSSALYKNR